MSGISNLIFWLLPVIMFPYLSTNVPPRHVTAPTFSFHTLLDVTRYFPGVHNNMTTDPALTSADCLAMLRGQIHPNLTGGGEVPWTNDSVYPIHIFATVLTFMLEQLCYFQFYVLSLKVM